MNSHDNLYNQYPNGRSNHIEDAVKKTCKRVRQYPVEIRYDDAWEDFSRRAGVVLHYLAYGGPEETDYGVAEIEQALEEMRNQFDDEYAR